MILVTLGTQDKSFKRLLDAVENEVRKGVIKEPIIVQAGCTKYKSKYMKIFDFIPTDEFDKLINKCDILITHGGVGTIVSGIKKGKIVIAAPRLKKFKEHTNDHQLQIINNLSKTGYILGLNDLTKLGEVIEQSRNFIPPKYVSNTENIIKTINDYINQN